MGTAHRIVEMMESSSWIRKMFETGAKLKAEFGSDNVFDFSLGNPDIDPPAEFGDVLADLARGDEAGRHGYMPNAGYPFVREAVAEQIRKDHGANMDVDHVIMTCGAGGAMNVALKALLNPGDRVLVTAPFFVEYGFYAENHGGTLETVPCTADFDPDVEALEKLIDERVAAVIVNSPNNPSGRVYTEEVLSALAEMLRRASRRIGRTVYLISDEPYRELVYGDVRVPSVLALYEHSLVAYSYSKVLSIPGERIGWLAVNPRAEESATLVGGAVLCNRILGFVNAPALMQRVVARLQGTEADIERYRRRKDVFCSGLSELGYRFPEPEGAFYLFPEAPGGDDLAVTEVLREERVLVVPGRGFGFPGHFRCAFCVDEEIIRRSMDGFAAVMRKLGG